MLVGCALLSSDEPAMKKALSKPGGTGCAAELPLPLLLRPPNTRFASPSRRHRRLNAKSHESCWPNALLAHS